MLTADTKRKHFKYLYATFPDKKFYLFNLLFIVLGNLPLQLGWS